MRIQELLSEGDYVDLSKVNAFLPKKTRDQQLAVQWGPKMHRLQARCNQLLPKLIAGAGPQYSGHLKGTRVVVSNLSAYANANATDKVINIDVTVFWDAPDDTLAVVMGHELGHIALGHVAGNDEQTPEKNRQDEYDADDFGIDLAKVLGYSKARVFAFMHSKKADYDQENKWASEPDSTHPNFDQRIDRAGQRGFQLSKGGLDQMDNLLTHLA